MSGMPGTPAWVWAGISFISGSCGRCGPLLPHLIGQGEFRRCGRPRASVSDEARLLEIVIGLDDFPQLVLGPLVAPVGVWVVPLHQLLEAGFDPLAVGAFIQVQGLKRLALQRPEPARRCRLLTP